jgi:hypothetical protein
MAVTLPDIYNWDTWRIPLAFTNPDGTDMDVSDLTPLFYLTRNKKELYSHEDDGVTIDTTNAATGEILITISKTVMLELEGKYVFYFKFREEDGEEDTWIKAEVKVVKPLNEPEEPEP